MRMRVIIEFDLTNQQINNQRRFVDAVKDQLLSKDLVVPSSLGTIVYAGVEKIGDEVTTLRRRY